jgi:hypothetical protein
LLPYEKARITGQSAERIFRALSSRVAERWRFISIRGPDQGEWEGIVDVLGVPKNTSQPRISTLKRGDLFDVVLIQMKGGSARTPTMLAERRRLRAVAKHYGARDVVLFQWRKGKSSKFFILGRELEWEETTGANVFG